jgi:phosphoglucosamine mutase
LKAFLKRLQSKLLIKKGACKRLSVLYRLVHTIQLKNGIIFFIKNTQIKVNSIMKSSSLFGTDGIRGRANVYPISPEMVMRIGQAVGRYFKSHYPNPRILIGKDTRRSGYFLEQALSSGICSTGVDTYFLGPLPTAGIAYLTRGMRANAGIVISASHNPFYDNGFKIFAGDGFKLPDHVEQEIEALIFSQEAFDYPTGHHIGTTARIDDSIGQYAVFLKEQFPKKLSLEGYRIVLDCAHGAAYRVAPKVFQELGAELIVIGASPDGTNINKEYGALYPANLQEQVKQHSADIGIAFDGDADRLVVVDDRGEILDGDELLAIFGKSYSEKNKLQGNVVVSTIMSNLGLEIALKKMGIKLVRTKVGDRYVVEEMRGKNYSLGGEQSGHIVFGDVSTTGDGILAALKLLEIVIEKQMRVSELKGIFQKLPQAMKNIDIPARIPLESMPELSKHINSAQESLGDEGRVLFRYSGTELKARIMVEANQQEHVQSLLEDLTNKALHSFAQYYNVPKQVEKKKSESDTLENSRGQIQWEKSEVPFEELESLSTKITDELRDLDFFCLWLIGDIGAGKTTLTGSILRSMGLPKDFSVTSPTFTYLSDYKMNKKTYGHLDFYRLDANKSSVSDLLSYMDYDGLFVEWPEKIGPDISAIEPTHILKIEKSFDLESRRYIFSKV